jgi:hypothetical protein
LVEIVEFVCLGADHHNLTKAPRNRSSRPSRVLARSGSGPLSGAVTLSPHRTRASTTLTPRKLGKLDLRAGRFLATLVFGRITGA